MDNPTSPVAVEDTSGQPGPSNGQTDHLRQTAEQNSQPGFSGGQPDHLSGHTAVQSNQPGPDLSATLSQMNSSMSDMAELLRQFVAEGRPPQARERRQAALPDTSESEDELADERPPKRSRGDDELSITTSDQDIRELINPPEPSERGSPIEQEDAYIKSLEAELSVEEPVGPKVNDSLANIANKRWGITLPAEKLKPRLAKHAQPENCEAICMAKVNTEIWGQLNNYQRKVDRRLWNLQQVLQKATFALLKSSNPLVGDSKEASKTMLADNIDAIALLGHAAGDVSRLRRERIKPALKPEFGTLCNEDHDPTPSKWLFGDDLAKQVRDAKDTNAIAKKIGAAFSYGGSNQSDKAGYSRDYHRRDKGKRPKYSDNRYYNQKDHFLGKSQKKPHTKAKPGKK